ncbi:conjugal transfer protein TraD [Tatlockia micdadei]|uniref:conjugal transfer protein TraD n=1 Tax=Legionella micdadei TaxID=451 RepID=UPI00156E6DD4|nr:conjugal transfer protein TraD [Legionella micdadei]NSL19595.1 conjugal transfer protein TraD [Legionella micdadei]
MDIFDEIKTQKQTIARCEKNLALERLKKRRADTRRKIELGGLVVKAGMAEYNKAIILGALVYGAEAIQNNSHYKILFNSIGNKYFIEK